MAYYGGVGVMDKPIQLQRQRQPQSQEGLKCPRCDSSNTKFCYYNNYSLSQPRHFCKACKRYWTRGGTLRNVPVGGGCRKNKIIKRPIITTSSTTAGVHHVSPPPPLPLAAAAANHQTNPNSNPNPNPNPDHNHNHHHQIPSSTTSNSNHHLNPLFYGLLPNYNPRFDSSITSGQLVSGYDHNILQQKPAAHDIMNAASSSSSSSSSSSGLGFSGTLVAANNHGHNNSNLTTFSSSSYNMMYGGGGSSSSMAFLLASSQLLNYHQQQSRFMGFASYGDDLQHVNKDLKIEEEAQNRNMEWNDKQQQQQQIELASDPNSLLWDTEGGAWLNDPAATNNNIINASSVPSALI